MPNRRRSLAAVALVVGLSSAGATLAQGCLFVGEIIHAENYDKIQVFREGRTDGSVTVSAYSHLYPGDTLRIQGDQKVWIRDRPGERRAVTSADGLIQIEDPQSCDIRPSLWDRLVGASNVINIWARGPMQAAPKPTRMRTPVNGFCEGTLDPTQIHLRLTSPQLLTADLKTIAVTWLGPQADVILESDDGSQIASVPAGDEVIALLVRPSGGPEIATLRVRAESDEATISLQTAGPDVDVGSLTVGEFDELSPAERVLVGVWLITKGPPEWRLQGMSMLHAAGTKSIAAERAHRQAWNDCRVEETK